MEELDLSHELFHTNFEPLFSCPGFIFAVCFTQIFDQDLDLSWQVVSA